MDVNIRKAKLSDLDGITKVESESFPSGQAASKESFEKRLSILDYPFYIAEVNDEIVGIINVSIINQSFMTDELYENLEFHKKDNSYQSIFGLAVIEKYRKQGIAHKLMEYVIKISKKENKKGLILVCRKQLISYYEGFGYKNIGVSKSVHGNIEWYDMLLEF